MELDLNTILSPIREKTHSPDSLDGTIFVNKSAIDATDSENDNPITYIELATIRDSLLLKLTTYIFSRKTS